MLVNDFYMCIKSIKALYRNIITIINKCSMNLSCTLMLVNLCGINYS